MIAWNFFFQILKLEKILFPFPSSRTDRWTIVVVAEVDFHFAEYSNLSRNFQHFYSFMTKEARMLENSAPIRKFRKIKIHLSDHHNRSRIRAGAREWK